jgi:hypothetical protein
MATLLHPPCCSRRLPTDDNTHLDEDIKSATVRFSTAAEILNTLILLRLERITALKPVLVLVFRMDQNSSAREVAGVVIRVEVILQGWEENCHFVNMSRSANPSAAQAL